MIRLIVYLVILLISVWIGLHLKAHPGSVLFVYQHWSVEMPLWFFLFGALIIFMIFHFILQVFRYFCSISGRYQSWSSRKRNRWARNKTSQGLIELTEGNWQRAEQLLVQSCKYSETPLINYLAAAKAAQEQGAYDRRDNLLRKAHASTPGAEVAVGLTQAQLQLGHQQMEQALATLRHLQRIVPQHPYVLKLLARLYGSMGDWQSLTDLLPDLRKRKVISSLESADLEQRIYQELLQAAGKSAEGNALTDTWKQLPKSLQKQPQLIETYARQLLTNGKNDEAEVILRDAIKRHWDNHLVELYGLTNASNCTKQIETAEHWLKHQKNNAALLLCLGRLCIRQKLWGKGREFLEKSVSLDPKPEAYRELGLLLEEIGEANDALAAYRKGLVKQGNEVVIAGNGK